MSELQIINLNGKHVTDSRDVAQMVGKEHAHLLRDIRNYITVLGKSKIGFADFFTESFYTDSQGKPRPHFYLTKKGCDMVANKITGEKGVLFTAAYVTKFEEMEMQLKQPKTQLEILQASINQLVEQERKMQVLEHKQMLIEKENQVLKTRVDNLDQVNIEGNPRQQFNGMIRLYAHRNGGQYSKAWKDFVQAFNTAYQTNFELKRQNYINKLGKDVSRPQYLEETGQLEDAIRVADKLLNQKKKA